MWLRLYTGILDDPKVHRLSVEVFRGWIMLMCVAKENNGELPDLFDIAFRLRISEAEAKKLIDTLKRSGFIDEDGETLKPHNWDERQYKDVTAVERMRNYRNAQRNATVTDTVTDTVTVRNADRNSTVTVTLPPSHSPLQSTETETEQRQSRGGVGEIHTPDASRAKPRSARRPTQKNAEDIIAELQASPAYAHLDVRLCYFRMVEWCKRNHKTPSEKRFVNWLNKEDKPMTANTSPPKKTGNANVGKSVPIPVSDPVETEAQMAEYIEELISIDDLIHVGQAYDAIIKRGGAKAEWEIRAVTWYELHKDEPATPEQVTQLKSQITKLANKH